MRRTRMAVAMTAIFSLPVWAADETLMAELKRLSARIEALETQNKAMEKALTTERISEKEPEVVTRLKAVEFQTLAMQKQARQIEALEGVSVSASLMGVMQSTADRNTATTLGGSGSRANYRGDIAVTLPGGEIENAEGRIFTHFRFGQGEGLKLRSSHTSGPNTSAFQTGAGADDSFAILAQAWYQLSVPLLGDGTKANSREHIDFTFGKMDPFVFFDQNTIADDESAKFLNNAFVHNPLLDSGGAIGADKYGFQPGAVVKYENVQQKGAEWSLSLGAFASDTGANWSGGLGKPLVMAQAETNARIAFLPGTYRAYAWTNGRVAGYDEVKGKRAGWGVSADQKVHDDVTLFGRYGHSTSGKVKFDRVLTLGMELAGNGWARAADAVGLAWGRLRTGEGYRAFGLTQDPVINASGQERVTELYYRFKLNNNLELTPDFQWISRPAGDSTAGTIKVVGLRAKVGF